ncbi:TetR/AcrR family transcriptional regulator [Fructobacillus evanidus]|uniref:AcrR family n=1 Tax=Fructobacillus evanidus TaxID=3064281 RepID=A0ABM9MW39_9LACO|nr:AcrR family [Fructobacillus sp. LMG 32999]CAK1229761.1 AcrR family [Fructobacillus sp. LMG 32999]CAK1232541.1 AcrR family [Fructobacillus sp. LMG 32999]CAK1232710.1 AcrR family [Fructobacillus sp. LMG 32999]CAK1233829.1 AcrR family [Fructobacillus sp. LMG 32999]
MEKETQTRKRGLALEQTIYAVTLRLFDQEGIDAVTFKNVAHYAKTSRSVLYRRWDSPSALLVAAVHHWAHENSGFPENLDKQSFPDTGSLRGDLIENARQIEGLHERISQYLIKFTLYQAVNGEAIGDDLLKKAEEGAVTLGTLLATRAINRGEIKKVPTTEVLMLLGNIRRYYAFIATQQAPNPEELIDQIVLPAWLANQQ